MKIKDAKIGYEYSLVEKGKKYDVTLIGLGNIRPIRAHVLIRDRAIDGGKRQSSREVVPIRSVSLRRLFT